MAPVDFWHEVKDMNALQSCAQFNRIASHKLSHTNDLGRGTDAGLSFVLLDSKSETSGHAPLT